MADLKSVVKNIVHEPTQFPESGNSVQLTVKRIGKTVKPGALDFGGSEYTEAAIEWLEAVKHNDEDKYGWWELAEGLYIVEFNETLELPDNTRVQLQIWEKALRNGVVHPTQLIADDRDPLLTFINVSEAGVGIKENARLSEIRVVSG